MESRRVPPSRRAPASPIALLLVCLASGLSSGCSETGALTVEPEPLVTLGGDDYIQEGTEEDWDYLDAHPKRLSPWLSFDLKDWNSRAWVSTEAPLILHWVPRVRHNVLYEVKINNATQSAMFSSQESTFWDYGFKEDSVLVGLNCVMIGHQSAAASSHHFARWPLKLYTQIRDSHLGPVSHPEVKDDCPEPPPPPGTEEPSPGECQENAIAWASSGSAIAAVEECVTCEWVEYGLFVWIDGAWHMVGDSWWEYECWESGGDSPNVMASTAAPDGPSASRAVVKVVLVPARDFKWGREGAAVVQEAGKIATIFMSEDAASAQGLSDAYRALRKLPDTPRSGSPAIGAGFQLRSRQQRPVYPWAYVVMRDLEAAAERSVPGLGRVRTILLHFD